MTSRIPPTITIRSVAKDEDAAIALIARRMGQTLVEVLGEHAGGAMYTPDWLEDRVRFHLDPTRSTGAVFVAVNDHDEPTGHTIVRVHDPLVDPDSGHPTGIFSTTYVTPSARRHGVADLLLARGEQWMREQGLVVAITHTDPHNHPLIELYHRRGYTLRRVNDAFVRLERVL